MHALLQDKANQWNPHLCNDLEPVVSAHGTCGKPGEYLDVAWSVLVLVLGVVL